MIIFEKNKSFLETIVNYSALEASMEFKNLSIEQKDDFILWLINNGPRSPLFSYLVHEVVRSQYFPKILENKHIVKTICENDTFGELDSGIQNLFLEKYSPQIRKVSFINLLRTLGKNEETYWQKMYAK
ncbi:MAG: hypothetical protein N2749_02790 [Clostridia bacterium]|nr:hypothetical protein [Clostridia bacterium]